ncbi:uncharacterized protein TNCV_2144791 [Trichonephila clavipes]|nr:uncharacterized protein TNCV_2144791 [Trichonephila clavipes]
MNLKVLGLLSTEPLLTSTPYRLMEWISAVLDLLLVQPDVRDHIIDLKCKWWCEQNGVCKCHLKDEGAVPKNGATSPAKENEALSGRRTLKHRQKKQSKFSSQAAGSGWVKHSRSHVSYSCLRSLGRVFLNLTASVPTIWSRVMSNEVNASTLVRRQLSCSNLDSNEDIRLSGSDCEESEESADVIDNIPVNPDIYVARDIIEWIPRNSNVPGRFVTRNEFCDNAVVQQASQNNVNISFFIYKGS